MTWTVTKRGVQANASLGLTQSVTLTVSGITAGHGIAVFVQYSDFQTDAVTVTDSASQTYTLADNILSGSSGQILASFYNLSVGTAPTTITATYNTTMVMQMVAALEFSSSIAGTPTLNGNHGLNNAAGASANSGAGNSSNGDLVLTGIIGDGVTGGIGSASLAITSVGTTTIQNDGDSVACYKDGSGVTTSTTTATSTWSSIAGSSAPHAVVELIFKEPSGASPIFVPRPRPYRPVIIPVKLWKS